jgi:hypothetical protein
MARLDELSGTRPSRNRIPSSQIPSPGSAVLPSERSRGGGQVASPRITTPSDFGQKGILELNQAFGDFFGGVSKAAEIARQGDHIAQRTEHEAQMADIEAAYITQKAMVDADNKQRDLVTDSEAVLAAEGHHRGPKRDVAEVLQGADPAKLQDRRFGNAYRLALADRDAARMAPDFQGALAQLDQTADPTKFLNDWLKDQVGTGSGDPIYDARLLSRFHALVDGSLQKFGADRGNTIQRQGQQALGESITAAVRSGQPLQPSDLGTWLLQADALFAPSGKPEAGAAFVFSTAMEAAATNPRLLPALSKLMAESDFANKHPAAYNKLQADMNERWGRHNDIASREAWNALDQQLRMADLKDDKQVFALISQSQRLAGLGGSAAARDAFNDKLATALGKRAELEAGLNRVHLGLVDPTQYRDISEMRKLQPEYLKRTLGNDFLSNPESLGMILGRFQGIASDDVKASLVTALNGSDPKRLAGALTALRVASRVSTPDMAQNFLNEDAGSLWAYARTEMESGKSADAVAGELLAFQATGDGPKEALKVDLKGLTGEDDNTKAKAKISTKVRSALETKLGNDLINFSGDAPAVNTQSLFRDVHIDGSIMDQLSASVTNLAARTKSTDLKALSKSVVESWIAGGSLTLLPGPDNSLSLTKTSDRYRFDAKGNPLIQFGQTVRNPDTGQVENTLSIFKRSAGQIRDFIPELAPDGAGSVYVEQHPKAMAQGLYILRDSSSGLPLVFNPGGTYTLGGEKITLPRDPAGIKGTIDNAITRAKTQPEFGQGAGVDPTKPVVRGLPRGVEPVEMNGRIYLMYRNHFEGPSMADIEKRAAETVKETREYMNDAMRSGEDTNLGLRDAARNRSRTREGVMRPEADNLVR